MGSSISGSVRSWQASMKTWWAGESSRITHSHYCWQGGLGSSPHRSFYINVRVFFWYSNWFSPNKWSRRVNQSNNIFVSLEYCDIAFRHCHSNLILVQGRRKPLQRCEFQEVRILWGLRDILEAIPRRDSWTKARIIEERSVKWILWGRASQMVAKTVHVTLRQGRVRVFKQFWVSGNVA